MEKKHSGGINIGTSSILVTFVLLALVTFAALSYMSARSDYVLSKEAADRTASYYDANRMAEIYLANIEALLSKHYRSAENEKAYYDGIDELLKHELMSSCCWNVNFPNCRLDQYKGVLYDRFPSQQAFWDDVYGTVTDKDGQKFIHMEGGPIKGAEEGSDIKALLDGYISIGFVRNMVIV